MAKFPKFLADPWPTDKTTIHPGISETTQKPNPVLAKKSHMSLAQEKFVYSPLK